MSARARYCVNCGSDIAEPAPAQVVVAEGSEEVPWRAAESIGVYLLAILATMLVSLGVAFFIDGDLLAITIVLVNEVALLLTALMWVRGRYGLSPRALGLRGFTRANVLAGIGLGIGGILASILVGGLLVQLIETITDRPVGDPEQIPFENPPTGIVLILAAIAVIILAPVAEEIFFRGFLFRGLRRWAKAGPAIVLSAAIFAVSHLLPLVMLPIFVLGVLLAAAVERRGTIVPAIVAHMTFNLFGFVVQFVLK